MTVCAVTGCLFILRGPTLYLNIWNMALLPPFLRRFPAFLLPLCLLLAAPFSLKGQYQYYGVTENSAGQWTLGLKAGAAYLQSDLSQPLPGFRGGLYGQRRLSRVFDLRLQLLVSGLQGQATSPFPADSLQFNSAWNGQANPDFGYAPGTEVYPNFSLLSLDAACLIKINLNRLFTPRGANGWDLYVMVGAGGLLYRTRVDAYDEAAEQIYPFGEIDAAASAAEIHTALKDLRDESYETPGQQDPVSDRSLGDFVLKGCFAPGAGFRISVNDHLSLGAEADYLLVGSDLLDGHRRTSGGRQTTDRDRLIGLQLLLDYTF